MRNTPGEMHPPGQRLFFWLGQAARQLREEALALVAPALDRAQRDVGEPVVGVVHPDGGGELGKLPQPPGPLAVEEGVQPGERVIVNGLLQVRPGIAVEPKLVDMPVSLSSK